MTLEAWPRASASNPKLEQFVGWPRTYATNSMLDSAWSWQLPADDVRLQSMNNGTLVELTRAEDGSLVRLMRLGVRTVGSPWRVPSPGTYRVRTQTGVDVWGPAFELVALPVLGN